MHTIRYRPVQPGLRLRRTKLEMPGWAGKPEPRRDGSHEHVWHCIPFSEGAQYGIELFYPYDNALRVTTPDSGLDWPPFRTFGEKYYTYQVLLDLKVEEGLAIRTEPHPRFYTDSTDS